MESKYYTPDITEFYPGFEFEFRRRHKETRGLYWQMKNPNAEPEFYKPWNKAIFEELKLKSEKEYKEFTMELVRDVFSDLFLRDNPTMDDIKSYLKYKAIRVKYLDIEDLQELGWKTKDNICYTFGRYSLYLLANRVINIYKTTPKLDPFLFIIFNGKIKNKSELQKLQKMLGI